MNSRRQSREARVVTADLLRKAESATVFIGPVDDRGICPDCGERHWFFPTVTLEIDGPKIVRHSLPSRETASAARAALKAALAEKAPPITLYECRDDYSLIRRSAAAWPSDLLFQILYGMEAERRESAEARK